MGRLLPAISKHRTPTLTQTGAGFIPGNLDTGLLDGVIKVGGVPGPGRCREGPLVDLQALPARSPPP